MSNVKSSWKCGRCGYTLTADAPPAECPSCRQNCEFLNVTCYLPECGGESGGGFDPRLDRDKEIK